MSDPREKFTTASVESKPSAPQLDIPVKTESRPPAPPAAAPAGRDAVPGHEVNQMAEFIAGGASLAAIRERWNDVAESWFVANWDALLARAARSRPARLPTAEDAERAAREADRLDVLFGRRRRMPGQETTARDFVVKSAIGR